MSRSTHVLRRIDRIVSVNMKSPVSSGSYGEIFGSPPCFKSSHSCRLKQRSSDLAQLQFHLFPQHRLQFQPHPINRLACDRSAWTNLFVRVRHLHLERAHESCDQGSHLGPGKAFSNAASRPVQERQKCIVAACAAVHGSASRVVDPTLGDELLGI